jgi:pimeloyl-ACP methyl ester carboxylesterase
VQGLLSLFVESSAVQKGFAEFVGDAIAFIEALKLEQADVLGFSLGVLLPKRSRF